MATGRAGNTDHIRKVEGEMRPTVSGMEYGGRACVLYIDSKLKNCMTYAGQIGTKSEQPWHYNSKILLDLLPFSFFQTLIKALTETLQIISESLDLTNQTFFISVSGGVNVGISAESQRLTHDSWRIHQRQTSDLLRRLCVNISLLRRGSGDQGSSGGFEEDDTSAGIFTQPTWTCHFHEIFLLYMSSFPYWGIKKRRYSRCHVTSAYDSKKRDMLS